MMMMMMMMIHVLVSELVLGNGESSGNRVLTAGGIERDRGVVGRRLAVAILGP